MGDDLASARPFRFDFLVPVSNLREKAQFADSTAARMPRESFAGNEFTEILRLLLPFPSGVEHHALRDSELGNARPVSANDLPTAQKATALRGGRVVGNHFETAQ
jgi:hypothetical protein